MTVSNARRLCRTAVPATIVLAAALALGLTSCSSGAGTSSSGTGTPADTAGIQQAQSLAQTYSQPPDSIGITQPVGKPIPANKTIVLVGAGRSGEGTIITYGGFEKAAQVLGWTVKQIQPDLPTPQDLQQALNQAIQLHPDAVAIAAVEEASIAPQLQQLQAMHVAVISTTGPDPTGGLITLQLMGTDGLSQKAAAVADKVIADMGRPGDIAMVGLQGYKIINDYSKAFRAEVNNRCPSCAIKETELPLTSLATTAGSDIVNFLRANPHVQGLFVGYDGMDTNLFSAARSAGVTLPKTYSLAVLPESMSNLASGQLAGAAPLDFAELGWRMADALARMFTDQTATALGVDVQYERPTIWSVSNHNVPVAQSGNAFPAVMPGYEQQYQKLWGK